MYIQVYTAPASETIANGRITNLVTKVGSSLIMMRFFVVFLPSSFGSIRRTVGVGWVTRGSVIFR